MMVRFLKAAGENVSGCPLGKRDSSMLRVSRSSLREEDMGMLGSGDLAFCEKKPLNIDVAEDGVGGILLLKLAFESML